MNAIGYVNMEVNLYWKLEHTHRQALLEPTYILKNVIINIAYLSADKM